MDATRHSSPWNLPHAAAPDDVHPPREVDVVVVGAGIAGLTAAVLLARANKSVAVLEMGPRLGFGDTGQTTAHLSTVPDLGYAQVRKNFGAEAAKVVARGHLAAFETIAKLVKDCNIACDFERLKATFYAQDDKQAKALAEERDAMQEAGLTVEPSPAGSLPFEVVDAFRLAGQGQFEPLAYLDGLAAELRRHGGVVCTQVRHKAANRGKDGRFAVDVVRLADQTEAQMHAGRVIYATHTPPTKLTLQLTMSPQRTYAMAFRVGDAPQAGLYYDLAEPYHYVRRHPHKDDANDVLIVGGCDHRSGALEDTEQAYAELEAYSRRHWPVTACLNRWSGQVFEPADGLPYIGTLPGADGSYVITGLSGNGMVGGTLGGIICAELAQDKSVGFGDVYRPDRIKPVAQAVDTLKHQVEVTAHMVGDRVKAWLRTQKVEAGEGAVMREGKDSLAVYNDGKKLHVLSPVCPHAGCYVKFNRAEKSWDCPCHGSRFAGDGTLLSGPAVSDLPKLPDHGDQQAV